MALYYKNNSMTTIEGVISDFATWAATCGWTIAAQTSTSVTVTKNGHSFTITKSSTTSINLTCTPSGGTACSAKDMTLFQVGNPYGFFSTGSGIVLGRYNSSYGWNYAALLKTNPLMGITGGMGVWGAAGAAELCGVSASRNSFYIDGSWTPSSGAGSITGSIGRDYSMVKNMPNVFNAGIIPFPVFLFKTHTTTTLFRPIGMVEGIYRIKAAELYEPFDEITIGSDTFLLLPSESDVIDVTSSSPKELFLKLAI